MTSRVYTLATGGWLVTRGDAPARVVGPIPSQVGESATEFAAVLRIYADDIERAGTDGRRFVGDPP